MNISHRITSGLAIVTASCLFILLAAMPAAAADKAASDCSIASIDTSFNARYPKAEHTRHKKEISEIQTLLKAVGYHPGKIDGWLGPDTDKALSQFCHSFKVDERLKQHNENTDETSTLDLVTLTIDLLAGIADKADKPKEILLSGGGCGCLRDFSALVYGFFPYWLADGKQQLVDFSLFERIGYFALKLDERGHIKRKLHFPADAGSHPNIAGFINRAHKYRVKVDVTFIASSWQTWNVDQIEKAVENIFKTVTREYEIAAPSWWRKNLPLVENNSTVHADGINLYFDNYDDSNNGSTLARIVKQLSLKLKQAESEVQLNIMLGLNLADVDRRPLKEVDQASVELGTQFLAIKKQFRKLEARFKALEKILVTDPDMVDRVFIFLTQDTSQSKKDLRQLIENAFSGEARRIVLRKMVPIVIAQGLATQKDADREAGVRKAVARGGDVEAAKDSDSQFEDDLTYMQDNFAGIGLWHLPLTQKIEVSEDEVADESALEKEAAEIEAAEKAVEEKMAIAREAEEKAVAAREAVKTATAVKEAAGTAVEETVAAAKASLEEAEAEKEAAEKEAAETAAAAKTAEKKAAEMKAAPAEMASQTDVDTIRQALESKYQRSGKFAFLGEKYEPYAIKLCEWACPNRWVFRIALDILLILALIYALWALGNCRLREFYKRRFLWFAVFGLITAVVFAVSAVCDPYWKHRAVFALYAIPLLILAGWALSRLRKMNQPRLP
jgi:hypothetical protein